MSFLSIIFPCIKPCKHSGLHHLQFTWLRWIKSCMKYLSHGFLTSRWLVHSRFVGIGNPLKVVKHYLFIREMVGLGHWDDFPMVSALMYMITHWIGPTMNHDIRLSTGHDFTKLFHCVVFQLWENIKLVSKLVVTFDLWERS